MNVGAWIHNTGDAGFAEQFAAAARSGLSSVRGYSIDYSELVAGFVRENDLSIVSGIHVDAEALVDDWRSQVKFDELERTVNLDCRLAAICVGNELREGGDDWNAKRFSARLSFGLARVIEEYRNWLDARGHRVPLTYAMEGIVFDDRGAFREHLWPLVDALDVVSVNLYPMTVAHWRGYEAFEVSAAFLREDRAWRRQMSRYEHHLRSILDVLSARGKRLFLSECGFPSGVGYATRGTIDGKPHVWPESDNAAFADRMMEYTRVLAAASRDYGGLLEAVYFYEWWDNHRHTKIWNVEQSPIHTCFGLCDHEGNPKLDVAALVDEADRS